MASICNSSSDSDIDLIEDSWSLGKRKKIYSSLNSNDTKTDHNKNNSCEQEQDKFTQQLRVIACLWSSFMTNINFFCWCIFQFF